jgi:hypothetical protein
MHSSERINQPLWRHLLADCGILDEVDQAVLPSVAVYAKGQGSKAQHIEQCLSQLTEPGQVVELRILGVHGRKRTDSGYFNALDRLAKAAMAYDGKAEGVYFTLNPTASGSMPTMPPQITIFYDERTCLSILMRCDPPVFRQQMRNIRLHCVAPGLVKPG